MTPWTKVKSLSLLSLLALAAVGACGKKESEDKGAKTEAKKEEKKTTTGSSTGTPLPEATTGSATKNGTGGTASVTPPCLALDALEAGGNGTGITTTGAGATPGMTTAAGAGATGGTTAAGMTTGAETAGAAGDAAPTVGDCMNPTTGGGTAGAVTAGGTDTATTTGGTMPGGTMPGTTGTATGGGTDLSGGKGIEGCAAEGKIWIPPTNAAPAACGEALYEDVCCSDVNYFYTAVGPSVANDLKARVAAASADRVKKGGPADLVWYGCSVNGGQYSIHAAKYSYGANGSSNVNYYNMHVTYTGGGPTKAPAGTACKETTMADIGYQAVPTAAVPPVDPVPNALDLTACGITDSTKAGVLAWLKDPTKYSGTGWHKDTAVVAKTLDSPHGKHKDFFNNALFDSVTAANNAHPTGSCGVKQLFKDDGTTIAGYALLVKTGGLTGGDNWFFYEIPDLAAATDYYGKNNEACVSCHKATSEYKDFIRSKPAQ